MPKDGQGMPKDGKGKTDLVCAAGCPFCVLCAYVILEEEKPDEVRSNGRCMVFLNTVWDWQEACWFPDESEDFVKSQTSQCMRNYNSWGGLFAKGRPLLDPSAGEKRRFLRQEGVIVSESSGHNRLDFHFKVKFASETFELVDGQWINKAVVAVSNAYSYLHPQATLDLSSDGGDTNGMLTRESVDKICCRLCILGILTEDSRFLDAGASYWAAACHIGQRSGCFAWGIEKEILRVYRASLCMEQALRDTKKIGGLINKKIAIVPHDLWELSMLGPTTVMYMFDYAFPLDLVLHLVDCAVNTPSLRHILSFKASWKRSVHDDFMTRGFFLVEGIPVTCVGGQNHTVYVYQRAAPAQKKTNFPLPFDDAIQKCLNIAWYGDDESRITYLRKLHTYAEDQLGKTRSQTRTKVDSGFEP